MENEFIENGVSIFNKNKELKNHKNELDEKEQYIEKLHGKVGQLTLEVDWLKKVRRYKQLLIQLNSERS